MFTHSNTLTRVILSTVVALGVAATMSACQPGMPGSNYVRPPVVTARPAPAASSNVPLMSVGAKFSDCKILYYDETVPAGKTSAMKPYFDEVTSLTGLKFVPATHAQATAQTYGPGATTGLLIRALASSNPYEQGYEESNSLTVNGNSSVVTASIYLRQVVSPGIRRHELGHLLNLGHNPQSHLMQPTPDVGATYSVPEIAQMKATVQRSTCS